MPARSRRHGARRPRTLPAATLVALVAVAPTGAADVEAGRAKAQVCTGCHGPEGMSVNDLWPNLAGQRAGYLQRALRAYRDGARSDPLMTTFARPLSDADIADLAAWYSSRKPSPCTTAPQVTAP